MQPLPHDPRNDPSYNKDGWHLSHWFGDKRHFRPWYDDDADYNTNAKSYYDYLGFRIAQLDAIIDAINKLIKRNIKTNQTNTVDLQKLGDWSSDDIITLLANVKVSRETLNAIDTRDDGLFVKNLKPLIDDLQNQVNQIKQELLDIKNQIQNINNELAKHDRVLRKIIQSLINNGSWSAPQGQDILDGDFVSGHGVASGNINFFGGTQDGGHYIRTNGGHTEDDVTAGI